MPNAIKYNVSAETLALKKGNFYIGTGDVGKGPTSSTGYYNGISPPSGGYTIYLNKESGGPSIYTVDNDTQLISLTNTIAGQTFTSTTQCLVYYAGQTDKVCFNRDYEPIITDGLVLNVDAGFDGSYPESGTTWSDLSLSGNNGTLINSPGFYDNGGGSIVFDGTDDYVVFSQVPTLTNQLTMECWYYMNTMQPQSQNRLISNNDHYVLYFNDSTDLRFYMGGNGGDITTSGTFISNWRHIVATYNGTTRALYVDGVLKTTSSASGNISNGNILNIGAFQNQSVYTLNGRMSQARIYNKGLTASEVLQNYNAMKDRFAFIFTVDTTKTGVSTSTQFKLPLVSSGSVNFVVEWGDGTTDTITTFNQAQTTHTYSSGGVYEVKIRGLLKGWQFANGGDKLKMGIIKNWGCLDISVSSGFYGCSNMTCVASDAPTISSTSLSDYFRACTIFNGAIGNWDVSNVTGLFAMFYGASSFASPLNNWNVSKVQDFRALFVFTPYNSPLNNWNTSSATDMGEMFNVAGSFNQDISNWNVSKNTSMYYMFRGCPFNKDISNWDVSKVTNMHFAFGQSSFNQNIGSWNVSGVTDMSYMFQSSSFNNGGSSSINNWNTSNVTNMTSMFQNCYAFNQNIGSWNTSKVTDMTNMFSSNASNIFNSNISGWDVSKVTSMSGMFRSCSLFNQPIGSWNTISVTSMNNMFENARDFNQNIGSWNVSNVTNFTSFMVFKTAANYSAANLDSIYNGWSSRSVKPNLTITFGSIKYNSTAQSGKNVLTSSPNNWTITDGGQV